MDVTIERQDGVLSVRVVGRIDSSNAYEFERALKTVIADNARAVLMDFEKLSYISSAGLRIVLLTAKSLRMQDARFALCSLSNQIQEVFEISGFDTIITIRQSRADALTFLDA